MNGIKKRDYCKNECRPTNHPGSVVEGLDTSGNSRVCASGARLAEHEARSMKSNHEVDAPTSMDLSASRPAWSKQSAVALSFDAAP